MVVDTFKYITVSKQGKLVKQCQRTRTYKNKNRHTEITIVGNSICDRAIKMKLRSKPKPKSKSKSKSKSGSSKWSLSHLIDNPNIRRIRRSKTKSKSKSPPGIIVFPAPKSKSKSKSPRYTPASTGKRKSKTKTPIKRKRKASTYIPISFTAGGTVKKRRKKPHYPSCLSAVNCNVGTKIQVYNRTASKTSGGLRKKDLARSKDGRIVAKSKQAAAKI